MRRFLAALILAASQASRSDTSGRFARSESRTQRGEARSEARSGSTSHTGRARAVGSHTSTASSNCTTCERDANGEIKRNPAAGRAFQSSNPCPVNGRTSGACQGYVVDHIVPLKRGGADDPSNMRWQTVAEAKAKDRIE